MCSSEREDIAQEALPHAGHPLVIRCAPGLDPAAAQSLKDLRADPRARVRDALEAHLRHEPTKVSKTASSGYGAWAALNIGSE